MYSLNKSLRRENHQFEINKEKKKIGISIDINENVSQVKDIYSGYVTIVKLGVLNKS
jgi:hypothetical protein